MAEIRELYNLRNDEHGIKIVQHSWLHMDACGFKPDNGLFFGTSEWFNAVMEGAIKKYEIRGRICRTFRSGHNDYAEFEIEDDKKRKTTWPRKGDSSGYEIGAHVVLTFVEQQFYPIWGGGGPVRDYLIAINRFFPLNGD